MIKAWDAKSEYQKRRHNAENFCHFHGVWNAHTRKCLGLTIKQLKS